MGAELPLGPVAISYQVVIWFLVAGCAVYGDRATKHLGAALALSSVAAFAEAWVGSAAPVAAALPFAAAIAALGGTWACLIVCALYIPRMFILGIEMISPYILAEWGFDVRAFFTVWGYDALWEIDMTFLTGQMVLAGGAISGGLAARSGSRNRAIGALRRYNQSANRTVFTLHQVDGS